MLVPSAVVLLDRLPLTRNGKLDRAALPIPQGDDGSHAGDELPRGEIEALVAQTWASVLGLKQLRRHDDVFVLGGHSLAAARVAGRLRGRLGIPVPLRWLFEAPSVAQLSARVAAALRGDAPHALSPAPVCLPREADGSLGTQASPAQERLWFLEQLEPGTGAYHVAAILHLHGPLDVDALQTALGALVARHEALRTTFPSHDGRPVQQIYSAQPAESWPLVVEDLQKVGPGERETLVAARARTDAGQRFDLEAGPLLRTHLLRLSPDEHRLVICAHHIVVDGWSVGVLLQELGTLYAATASGAHWQDALPPPALQYADCTAWQRQSLTTERVDQLLGYWRCELGADSQGVPIQPLAIPTDRARRTGRPGRAGSIPVALPDHLAQRIRNLCRAEGLTPFMVLLAAYQIALGRWSRQLDVTVGTPVAGREHQALEQVVGCFVNTLVVRTSLAGQPSFRSVLGRVRRASIGALAHAELPFEVLVDALRPTRDTRRSALFQAMFVFQNTPTGVATLPGLTTHAEPLGTLRAKFELTLTLADAPGGGWAGELEYDADLFEHETAERFARHLSHLLEAAVEAPDTPVDRLPLEDPTLQRQVTAPERGSSRDDAAHVTLSELFDIQAARTPDAPAVLDGAVTLSYRDLQGRVEELASRLRTLGVGPDTVVGICLERSAGLVVGVLGALQAGAAYLPLDPSYPRERLAFMVADARPVVLVTERRLIDRLPPAPSGTSVCCLDDSTTDLTASAEERSLRGHRLRQGDQPAYVVYTSGSTGTPKGVVGTHLGAINRIRWMWQEHPFGADEVCCLKTSLSFVDSVWELFGPLLAGVPLVTVPEAVVREPRRLVALLRASNVTRLVLVPSLLRALLESGIDLLRELPRLRFWTASGEILPVEVAREFTSRRPDAQLLNLYGSSEVAADATGCSVSALPLEHLGRVPIGRPIAGLDVYVLDARLEPVPVGLPGEIYVGGAGLARGYLRRPALTAERFVPHPFCDAAGVRLYRTGDYGRFRADGLLEYLGRVDQQVKLRGNRIELGEVEAALWGIPGVAGAVVVVDGGDESDGSASSARLIAYVTPSKDACTSSRDLDPDELRRALARMLPEYMVPSLVVPLDVLPLTSNGKVDRRALPAPDVASTRSDSPRVEPRTETERVIASIWAEVLHLKTVGVFDDFFELGGHSLQATQIISRVRQVFQVELPLLPLFEDPTIAGLAQAVDHSRQAAPAPELPPLMARPRQAERINFSG